MNEIIEEDEELEEVEVTLKVTLVAQAGADEDAVFKYLSNILYNADHDITHIE